MGTLRLLLALGVVAGHSSAFEPFRLIEGGLAVRLFFVVSGFYMALVLREKYQSVTGFYFQRVLRLYPLYLCVVLASVAWFGLTWLVIGYRPPPFWIEGAIANMSWWQRGLLAGANWTMVGLDIVPLFRATADGLVFLPVGGTESINNTHWLGWVPWVRQGWSIGSELWFYLLAPWILRGPLVVRSSVGVVSFALFIVLSRSRELTYFFFPANLWLFIVGTLLYDFYRSRYFRAVNPLQGHVLVAAIAAVVSFIGYVESRPLMLVLLSATALSIPYVFEATKASGVQSLIGNLSYPVYLAHLLVIAILAAVFKTANPWVVLFTNLVVAGALFYFIERPVEALRRSMQRSATGAAVPAGVHGLA